MFRLHHWVAALLLIAATMALAQESPRPNFTGIWNLDKEQSDFGGLQVPDSARYLIRHLGAKLEMQYEEGKHVTRVDVVPDGEEHVLETGPDTENLARVYWEGPVLVFDGRIKPMPMSHAPAVKWMSRWTLSPDRKVLTINREMSTQQVTAHQRVVFVRQLAAEKKAQ
jgi:hypothetical protein